MKDKKIEIIILAIIVLSLVGIGIAFAAFSQTLTINGAAEVEASSWKVVFEGLTNPNTIDAPVLTGTAQEITHPTIKSNSTKISTYSASLKTPGDSITYNFKIHNKGDYAASISSLKFGDKGKQSYNPSTIIPDGYDLIKNKDKYYENYKPYSKIKGIFYYTLDNSLVGNNSARDCLEPGETVLVSLKIVFSSVDETDPEVLPTEDIVLDNLGISINYNQSNNGSCIVDPIEDYNGNFINYDNAYYTYEGKIFKGTGVNNVIITENIIGIAQYSSQNPIDNGEGTNPRYVFVDTPAKDMAEAYCTGCRLISIDEAISWCGSNKPSDKCSAYNGDSYVSWWTDYVYTSTTGNIYGNTVQIGMTSRNSGTGVKGSYGVRPAVDIPSIATMSGSGTQLDPYVITIN